MLLSGSIARPFVSGAASAPVDPKIAPAPRAREMTIFLMTQLLCVRGEPTRRIAECSRLSPNWTVKGAFEAGHLSVARNLNRTMTEQSRARLHPVRVGGRLTTHENTLCRSLRNFPLSFPFPAPTYVTRESGIRSGRN